MKFQKTKKKKKLKLENVVQTKHNLIIKINFQTLKSTSLKLP